MATRMWNLFPPSSVTLTTDITLSVVLGKVFFCRLVYIVMVEIEM